MSFDVTAKYCLKISPLIFFLLFPKAISAQEKIDDTIVITADRIKSTSKLSASDVVVFDSKKIGESASKNLVDLLSQESDLNITSSGASGSLASLYLRGAGTAQTLVVIDGIVMNDASNPTRQFDLGKLSLNNIEKVEVLKGSQGMAYGSNAIGGVIVIKTKTAKPNIISGSQYFDYGTYNTLNAGFNFQKSFELANISFGADHLSTDGFSAANKNSNTNSDNDASRRSTLSFNANRDITNEVNLKINLRYVNFKSELDDCGGTGCDSPNVRQSGEDIYANIETAKNWDYSNAETKISYNKTKHHRADKNIQDIKYPNSYDLNSIAKGEINATAINHTYEINDTLKQNIDISFTEEKDNFNSYNSNLSSFLYHQLELSKNIFNFGLRLDHNKLFNDHLTYKAAAAHSWNNSLLKLSYSTGFQAPTLFQLFDPEYHTGNINLTPETSQSVDLSFNTEIGDTFKSSSSLFATFLENRISTLNGIYANKGKANIFGIEQKIGWSIFNIFSQHLSLTVLRTKDISTGKKLERRPDFTLKNNFSISLNDQQQLDYDFTYVSSRDDVDGGFPANQVKMPKYLLHDLSYLYSLDKSKEFYLKFKNIFNLDYEEIYGYGTAGRTITLGAQYKY